ncbi:MAG: hypothetical protein GX653_09030 [Clostridiales bacterium]|nr:hypothetical protein [Clostridiales bacterium]
MKRLLLLIGLLLLLCLPALGEDITAASSFSPGTNKALRALTDRDYTTHWAGSGALTIKADQPIHGLYLCWSLRPKGYTVEGQAQGGQWQSAATAAEQGFAHEYVPLDGFDAVRLQPKGRARLAEVYVLGAGEVPPWVQRWRPTVDKADILLLIAHPDDEVVMFGGMLPTYAGQMDKQVLVASMTAASTRRQSELLDSLWTCGVKDYPVFGGFDDKYFKSMSAAYSRWGTRKVRSFVVELYRKYRPEVVVTHDKRGEYGHGAHQVCADVARAAVGYAANAENYADIYQQYGTWQVKKLYLHLAKEGAVDMDWDQPLSAFEGKTGFEVAKEGYQKHRSQHQFGFEVYGRKSRYSTYRFGLVHTTVGPDVQKNDFLENIPVQ